MTTPGGLSRPEHAGGSDREPVGPAPAPARPSRRWIHLLAGVVVIGLIVWGVRARANAKGSGKGKAPDAGDRIVAVLAAPVEQGDVPIYVEGLGTVAAFATVTVKPQVDGRLDKVLFTEGQTVHKGEVLAQIDPRPFAIQAQQASATIAKDKAQLEAARLNLARYDAQRREGVATQQQVDDTRATVAQLEATVAADDAVAANAHLNLTYARITSPLDGVTGVRQVDAGNIVHQSDPNGIVVITQLDPIAVFFSLPQDDLPSVQRELANGPLTVEAYSRDGSKMLATGQVALVDNQINQATATIKLKSVFPNPDKTLWPNQFVKARLLLTTRKAALTVPASAIQRGPSGTIVYIVGPDKTATVREVVVERTQGEIAIMKSGLNAGEQVVADGQAQLRPGSKVAPQPFDKSKAKDSGPPRGDKP